MAATINASTSSGLVSTADNSGILRLQTASTTALTIDASQNVSLAGNLTTTGNLLFNSGYGSAVTAYGCRAWVNFDGSGTVSIRGSGNVSSITDNATGLFTINFTSSMPDVNYAISGWCRWTIDNTNYNGLVSGGNASTYTISAVQVGCTNSSSTTKIDPTIVAVAVFR